MFKKSLAAIAVLGTAAGFACAADVTLYGVVDEGFVFNQTKVEKATGATEKTNSFGLESGVSASSRFGLKGSEDLGNGLKVGFKLENGFRADSGELKSSSRIFDREASVTLSGDFGALSMGRMGGVGSSAGVDAVYSTADAFDGGDNNVLGLAISDRYDNMVQYQTPVFAGVQGTFQYSFKQDNKDEKFTEAREGSAAANRYMGAALNGSFGPVQAVLGYEFFNYASNNGSVAYDVEDGQIVYLGGNYDCGFAKTFVMAQYFKDLSGNQLNAVSNDVFDGAAGAYEGYGLHLGTQFAALAGDFTVGAYYVDGNTVAATAAEERDLTYYGVGARYEYALSKRTGLYTGVGYGKTTLDAANAGEHDTVAKVTQAYAGLVHKF